MSKFEVGDLVTCVALNQWYGLKGVITIILSHEYLAVRFCVTNRLVRIHASELFIGTSKDKISGLLYGT
jgi:hypothetical protein